MTLHYRYLVYPKYSTAKQIYTRCTKLLQKQ